MSQNSGSGAASNTSAKMPSDETIPWLKLSYVVSVLFSIVKNEIEFVPNSAVVVYMASEDWCKIVVFHPSGSPNECYRLCNSLRTTLHELGAQRLIVSEFLYTNPSNDLLTVMQSLKPGYVLVSKDQYSYTKVFREMKVREMQLY